MTRDFNELEFSETLRRCRKTVSVFPKTLFLGFHKDTKGGVETCLTILKEFTEMAETIR
jgi:hypothetical protein